MKAKKLLVLAAAICLLCTGCAFDGDNFNPNLYRQMGVSIYV